MKPSALTQNLQHLNKADLYLVLWYARFKWLRHKAYHLPLPIKLSFIHGLTTLLMLSLYPPPPTIPPVAILITWAASFCTALTIVSFLPRPLKLFHRVGA
ncbi:hypothetical protein CCP3SC15_450018 [Gammaproteobacteria bacterium]